MSCDKSFYPQIEQMADIEYSKKWVPESLLVLLKELIPSELKQVSIGQCISQSAKPRSMLAPIPFGVVDVDKSFESKWFINHLAKLGFSVSYYEVANFKRSAAEASGGDSVESSVDDSVEGGDLVGGSFGDSVEGGDLVGGNVGDSVEGGVGDSVKDSDLVEGGDCLLYTSPSPRDGLLSRMPSSA